MVILKVPLTTDDSVRDIFISEEDHYAIVVTFSGIEFIDLYQGKVVSSGIVPGGYEPLCAAADWATSSGLLYVGTNGGGIFSAPYHPVRKDGLDFSDWLQVQFSTSTSPAISADRVNDLETIPGALLVGTSSGVDFISNLTNSSTKAEPAEVKKVNLSPNGDVAYWLTASSVAVNYDLTSTLLGGIITVDFEYTNISNPPLPASDPIDITISQSSPRALGFPTSSGLLILEEKPGSESTASTNTVPAPNPLSESPDPTFVSASFAVDATFNTGYIFTLTEKRGYTFDLSDNTPVGIHPQDLSENVPEVTFGQALNSGTQTIIRTTSVPV